MRRKRTEITIETDRTLVITGRGRGLSDWCPACAAGVRMLTVDEAAALAGVSPLTMFRMIEVQQLHCVGIPGGPVLVCFNSLFCKGNMEGERP
ncbi:MAG TPA: hypothetical protein VGJ55_07380 [Pyrinomonadaceae bacterium]|jgi:hypothetical protein